MGDTVPDMADKINEYTRFINNVLRPELKRAEMEKAQIKKEIQEYEELQTKILQLQRQQKQQNQEKCQEQAKINDDSVDLGYQKVYCEAVIDDPSTIFIDVGLGFFVELQTNNDKSAEAIQFIRNKIHFISKHKLSKHEKKCKEIQDHIYASQMILDQLTSSSSGGWQ